MCCWMWSGETDHPLQKWLSFLIEAIGLEETNSQMFVQQKSVSEKFLLEFLVPRYNATLSIN